MVFGVIYVLTNIVNGKQYIGQAQNTVSLNKTKWGAQGRWKSHIREALRSQKDHCVLLNNAIRKHGANNFNVDVICECTKEEIDDLEERYILEYNTLLPNGYNMVLKRKHPSKREETVPRKMERLLADIQKKYLLLESRSVEDSHLPLFICTKQSMQGRKSFMINKFPTSTDLTSWFSKEYQTLESAVKDLECLKVKHKDVWDMIVAYKYKDASIKITNKLVANLPEHIFPIVRDNKLAGYYVEGVCDINGNAIPRKDFTENTNRWNLDKAKRYIMQIELIKKSNTQVNFASLETLSRRSRKQVDGFYLPKYMGATHDKDGNHIGFQVQGIKNKTLGTLSCKRFIRLNRTLQQNYENALAYLEEKKQIYMCQSSS